MADALRNYINGLITELRLQGDEPTNLSINVQLNDHPQVTAISNKRIYVTSNLTEENGEVIWASLAKAGSADSFHQLEQITN